MCNVVSCWLMLIVVWWCMDNGYNEAAFYLYLSMLVVACWLASKPITEWLFKMRK